MPVYLTEVDDFSKLEEFKSVLIVPCRFCPAASLAVKTKTPYFAFLKHLLKTPAYEEYVETVQTKLESMGLETNIFRSYLPHQFVVCMWTDRRRQKLRDVAQNYDAVLVMGCEAALDTIHDSIDPAICQVFQGMRTQGIMSIKPLFGLPCDVSLELNRITPLLHQTDQPVVWSRL